MHQNLSIKFQQTLMTFDYCGGGGGVHQTAQPKRKDLINFGFNKDAYLEIRNITEEMPWWGDYRCDSNRDGTLDTNILLELSTTWSAIHNPCPCVFWSTRNNFTDIELKLCIFS